MDFNSKEIALCKQVAKKYRKKIKRGDWYNDLNVGDGNLDFCNFNQGVYWTYLNKNKKVTPLWTISDCLEFLRKENYRVNLHENVLTDGIEVTLNHPERIEDITNFIYKGKTVLEACLKAVLAVLEEKS